MTQSRLLTSISGRSQVVRPSPSRGFSAVDFSTLIRHEVTLRIGPVRTAIQGMYRDLDVFDRSVRRVSLTRVRHGAADRALFDRPTGRRSRTWSAWRRASSRTPSRRTPSTASLVRLRLRTETATSRSLRESTRESSLSDVGCLMHADQVYVPLRPPARSTSGTMPLPCCTLR